MAEPSTGGSLTPELEPELRQRFRDALAGAGFKRLGVQDRKEHWAGSVTVRWSDPRTAEEQETAHRVRVVLPPGFPFAKPWALPLDRLGDLGQSRHAGPVEGGALCLYPDAYRPDTQRGWAAWRTGEEFVERIREWFVRAHRGEWTQTDRPPDLHLAFESDGFHPLMLVSDDWAPLASAASGRFGIWQRDDEVAFAGTPVPGATAVPERHSDRILEHFSLKNADRVQLGAWLRLAREPLPRRTLGAMMKQIDAAAGHEEGWTLAQLRHLLPGAASAGRAPVLALGYPDPSGPDGEAWLFLRVGRDASGAFPRWTKPETTDRPPLEAFETVSVSRASLMRRVGPAAAALAGKRALIFGVGALGSVVALLLAKSGVERLHAVDGDRMRPGNAVRHVGGVRDTPRSKTVITNVRVWTHVPDCVVDIDRESWDPDLLSAWVRDADIVIDATVNEPFSLLLNAVCVREDRPALYAVTMRRAAIGRLRVVRPRVDACLVCYTEHVRRPGYPVVPPGDESEFFEMGCGVPTVEAPAVDVEATANWTARAGLWLLRGVLGPRNHCLVVNDVVPDARGDLARVGVHWSVYPPLAECPTCGQPVRHATADP